MFKLEFSTSNITVVTDSPDDTRYEEAYRVAEVLTLVARRITTWAETSGVIHDASGKTIGKWKLT